MDELDKFAVKPSDELEQFAVTAGAGRGVMMPTRPPATGRRGGTVRELQLAYGKQGAPGVQPEITPTESGTAFLTGLGQGTTFGLGQYGGALGVQGLRALTGGAPVSYGQALDIVRQQQRELQQQYPVAYGAGAVTGAVAPAALVPARTALQAFAYPTVTGAISGAASSEELSQVPGRAAAGAAIGGTIGLLGSGTYKAVDVAQQSLINNIQARARDITSRKYQESLARGKPLSTDRTEKIYNDNIKMLTEALDPRLIGRDTKRVVIDQLKGGARSVVVGGIIGGTAAPFSGMDPSTGAMLGAAGAYGATKAAVMGTGTEAGKLLAQRAAITAERPIRATADIGTRLATQGFAQNLQSPEEIPIELQQFAPAAPVQDTRTRLQRLADDARARFQGLQ